MKRSIKEQRGIEYYVQLPYSILLHVVEDEDKKYWIAEVPELPGCKSHGSTVEEAVRNVEEAKKDWIIDSLEEGEEVPIPIERDRFSGKTIVRMSRSLHRALSLMAESEKLSLNQLMITILAKEVGRLSVLNRVEEKVDRLLNRINDDLEEEELRTIRSKSIRAIAGLYEQEQYVVVDAGHTLETPAAVVNIKAFTRGAVSTAAPSGELRLYPYPQRPGWGRIISSAGRAKEIESEDIVESEQK